MLSKCDSDRLLMHELQVRETECTSLLEGSDPPDADLPSCFIQSGSAGLHMYNTASLCPGLGFGLQR